MFNTSSWAFNSGVLKDFRDFDKLNKKQKIEFFLGAVYYINVDMVLEILNQSKISITFDNEEQDYHFYKLLNNMLSSLHNVIENGNEDAIIIYSRVVQYFRIE